MTDRLFIATRKGLFEVARHAAGGKSPTRIFSATRFPPCCRTRMARSTPRSISAILGPSCGAATAARVGVSCRSRVSAKAGRCRSTTLILGRSARSGHSSRAGCRGGSGPARCRAGCSAPMTAASPGRSTSRFGVCQSAGNGSASPAASSPESTRCSVRSPRSL